MCVSKSTRRTNTSPQLSHLLIHRSSKISKPPMLPFHVFLQTDFPTNTLPHFKQTNPMVPSYVFLHPHSAATIFSTIITLKYSKHSMLSLLVFLQTEPHNEHITTPLTDKPPRGSSFYLLPQSFTKLQFPALLAKSFISFVQSQKRSPAYQILKLL